MSLRSLSLFTGYGGLDLALEGYARPIGYCEIERYAQGIIASRIADGSLPNAPIYPDVTKLTGERGACDIIVGGFPCQDISVAGRGAGLEGKRSGLFYEVVRLTKEIQPSFVFLENSPAIRTRGLRDVIRAFTDLGYDCRWTRVSANSVGAPHKRDRWFMVAYSGGEGLERHGSDFRENEKFAKPSDLVETRNVANTNCLAKKLRQAKEREQNPFGIWRLEGNNWDDYASFLLRMDHGDTVRTHRIKALGNGVVPAQARKAFEALIGF